MADLELVLAKKDSAVDIAFREVSKQAAETGGLLLCARNLSLRLFSDTESRHAASKRDWAEKRLAEEADANQTLRRKLEQGAVHPSLADFNLSPTYKPGSRFSAGRKGCAAAVSEKAELQREFSRYKDMNSKVMLPAVSSTTHIRHRHSRIRRSSLIWRKICGRSKSWSSKKHLGEVSTQFVTVML